MFLIAFMAVGTVLGGVVYHFIDSSSTTQS